MEVSSFNLFFALLALAAAAGAVAIVILWLLRGTEARRWRHDIADAAPWLAFVIAAASMAGSLYYSEIAHFTPCKLCWFQRICMYPLVVVLGVAALRRDRGAHLYALPLSVTGMAIAAYHYQLQRFPDQGSTFCSFEAPCTAKEVDQFGFVTIPFMALCGFLLITVLLVHRRAVGAGPTDELPHGDELPLLDPQNAGPHHPDPHHTALPASLRRDDLPTTKETATP